MAKTAQKPARKAAGRRKTASEATTRGKNLVIVESPAKAKTINRYLGRDFVVKASMGHVRDLPKRDLGVDIEHGFSPTYEPLDGRKKILTDLKKHAKSASQVFLATDLDREGEAIAWHLAESLGVSEEKIRRVVFNEITQGAIREAFAQPRSIDTNKVNAQQARRILDRIVGYKISPLLWRKVAGGLSAGRVQSVAVRLIVEREREVEAFMPAEYWKIAAIFTPDLRKRGELTAKWAKFLASTDQKGNAPTREARQQFLADHNAFRAELLKWDAAKFQAGSAETALEIAEALGLAVEKVQRREEPKAKGPAQHCVEVLGCVAEDAGPFTIAKLNHRDKRSRPPAPLTTVSMQQQAAVRLRFSASRTMRIAQQLYEGVEIPKEGSVGLITYMRTDSTHLSNEAIGQVRSLIEAEFGKDYLPEKPNRYASGRRAQEAHEAVRPTDVSRHPEDLRGALNDHQFKLYRLIWQRFVACQMAPAIWKVTEADIVAEVVAGGKKRQGLFKAIGRTLAFDGYFRAAGPPKGGEQILPALDQGQQVAPVELLPTQHFTQAPPRYTEASLVKAMEADGIGRPSTYAPIIQTIQARGYVEQEDHTFRPTDLGIVVTDKLVKHFPNILDVRFTAHMEDQLDRVEDAQAEWVEVLEEFYRPFSENLEKASEEMIHAKAEEVPSDYTCEKCDRPMVYKFSKTGRYLACTGYPKCKTTCPVDKEGKKSKPLLVDVACTKCSSPMTQRKGRYGPFLSCSRYPDCDGVVNLDRKGHVKLPSPPPLEVDLNCPKCESPLNLRRSKRGPWLGCSKYPKCRGRLGWKTLAPAKLKELELQLLNHEKDNPQPLLKTLSGQLIGPQHTPEPLEPEPGASSPEPGTSNQ